MLYCIATRMKTFKHQRLGARNSTVPVGSQLCLIELPNLTCVTSFWTKQSLSDLVSFITSCDLRFYPGTRKFLQRFLFGERHLFVAVCYTWLLTYGTLNRCPFWRLIGISKQPLRYSPSFGGVYGISPGLHAPKLAGWLHAWCRSCRLKKSTWCELERSVKRMRFGG